VKHIQPFLPRKCLSLPTVERSGWKLKRYGILAKGKKYDVKIAASALDSAIERLPIAGKLSDPDGNHGVGFHLIHFADVAVVSPVFFWIWGSVLANTDQMRAQWDDPGHFETGVAEVVGCVWEMQIICFETQSWTQSILGKTGTPDERLSRYLEDSWPGAE